MARIFDRRIELDRSGEIPYVEVGYTFRFIWIPSSQLHVCNTYLKLLITLLISDNGKIYAIKKVFITRGILKSSWIDVFGK